MYRHRVGRHRARDHVRCDRVLPCDHVHGDVSPRLSHTSAFVLGSTHPPFPACLARRAMRQWSRPPPAHPLAHPPVIRRRPLLFSNVSPRRPPRSHQPSSGTAPPPALSFLLLRVVVCSKWQPPRPLVAATSVDATSSAAVPSSRLVHGGGSPATPRPFRVLVRSDVATRTSSGR